jgi:hypothetical protein
METAYGLKEKILVASLIRDMGKAVSVEKIVLGKGLPPSTIDNQRVRTAQQLKKLWANIQYTKYVVDVYLELLLLLLRQQSHKNFPYCDIKYLMLTYI